MNIAVIGAGAMGSLYGGLLSLAGHQVVLVDVSQAHIDAVNQQGLLIELQDNALRVMLPAMQAAQLEKAPDLFLLFTKTVYSRAALQSVRHAIGSQSYILSLQNGLGNEEVMGEFFSAQRIMLGTTDFPSDFVAPGQVRSKGRGTTRIMTLDGQRPPMLEQTAAALEQAGFNCQITEDVFVSIWEKVAFNSAMNALTAICRLRLGDITRTPEGLDLAYTVAREVIDIANRKGVKARKEHVLSLMEKDFREHAGHMPSMLQDVLAKRLTEVDFIDGAVVREAQKLGLQAPATQTLYQLVKVIQANYDNLIVG